MALVDPVRIDGLGAFRKELRALGGNWPKQMGEANRDIANIVVTRAVALYPQSYTPRTGRAQGAIRAAATQRAAQVKLGKASVPYVIGQEFGGGRRASTRQFRPWRGNGPNAGYFLYPAVREKRPEIGRLYLDRLEALAEKAFPDG